MYDVGVGGIYEVMLLSGGALSFVTSQRAHLPWLLRKSQRKMITSRYYRLSGILKYTDPRLASIYNMVNLNIVNLGGI